MFRRELKVDVVKKNKKDTGSDLIDEIERDNKRQYIAGVIHSSIIKIGIGVCAFVILDTVRQVLVETAKK